MGPRSTSRSFADVRRSSDLARNGDLRVHPPHAALLLGRDRVLFEHEALLDKFVGDEVVGFFLPFMAGEGTLGGGREARALFGARLRIADGPWIPSVRACNRLRFVATLACEASEFTALGDTINVAAHLAATAAPGEILITDAVAASLETDDLERRHLS